MRIIKKFMVRDEFTIKIPTDAKILDVQNLYQDDIMSEQPVMWIMFESSEEAKERIFKTIRTHDEIQDNWEYVATWQESNDRKLFNREVLEFHLVEVL